MNIRLNSSADDDAIRVDDWWRQNRPEAPTLFIDELVAALELLRTSPAAGERYKKLKGHWVRRTLLEKTRQYVYHFANDEEGSVIVLAIWGTERRGGPPLRFR
jgi:plasmid stabilization system protein ParE